MRRLLRIRCRAFAGVLGAAMVLVPALCNASGSATAQLGVTASVQQHCTASSPTLDFGNYNPVTTNANAPLDSSTTITLTCTHGTNVGLGFDLGSDAAGGQCGSSPQRCMSDGTEFLNYNIYSSPDNRSSGTPWTTPVTESLSGSNAATISIFGRVPGGQDVRVGSYADSIVATVFY